MKSDQKKSLDVCVCHTEKALLVVLLSACTHNPLRGFHHRQFVDCEQIAGCLQYRSLVYMQTGQSSKQTVMMMYVSLM